MKRAPSAGGYVRISPSLIDHPDISDGAFRTYAILIGHAKELPSIEDLAEMRGVDSRTIGRHIKELREANLIGTVRRGLGKSNLYVFRDGETWTSGDGLRTPAHDK